MLQVGRDLDLGEEPLHAEHGAEFGLQHLERHAPVVLQVAREVHRRHAAGADLMCDLVAVGEGRGELVERVHIEWRTGKADRIRNYNRGGD